ncbi:hypothetical protein A2U01_0066687 [Trifolium medium]|uniref:Uncharacterized protein n=1 Tax=Trifolium medium TaxID=97028 RepID=A0A392S9C8_9FABA|nr:hypothetical protein [Trifolium medium]
MRAAQGVMARCAPMLRRFGFCSAICAPRKERMARHASLLEGCIRKARSLARCAASSSASRTFIVHHVRRTEQVARRADAKSI